MQKQKRASGRRLSVHFASILAIALCFALIGGSVGLFLSGNAIAETAEAEPTSYSAVYSADNPVPEIAANVRPAVVQVINKAKEWNRQTGEVTDIDQAYGSGVYIDERGYIVTNYHVIEGAESVEILTLDDQRLDAEIVGYDDGTDIAILKVEEGSINANPVPLGDSDALQIGELAICIGNPGASDTTLFGTVTAGIISALDRENVGSGNFTRYVNTIQTDAAINSGNSGGALLNGKGELVGIPTLKMSYGYTSVYEGLGFAIPVNTVKEVMADIIEHGKVLRPRLGIGVRDNAGPDEALRNYPPAGVLVVNVEEGGPAETAGLKANDVITEFNGVRVKSFSAMTIEIDKLQAGDTAKLTVYRYYDAETGEPLSNYEKLELEVTLEIIDDETKKQ